jgi:hypothetical protein
MILENQLPLNGVYERSQRADHVLSRLFESYALDSRPIVGIRTDDQAFGRRTGTPRSAYEVLDISGQHRIDPSAA